MGPSDGVWCGAMIFDGDGGDGVTIGSGQR